MSGLLIHPDDVLCVSPPMNSSGDPGVLSAPLSPNRVRKGHSQDMPAEGSLFAVSPDTPGYSMPPNYVGFNNPFLELRLHLPSVRIQRAWIRQRRYLCTIYHETVVLV